ncbi:TonB-dependent receptor [Teredinibacter turnerae]|uniref:TonB-dependent receptor n=1 Tax=Teredinibacter turnerae TaxID=2426 RepID=UPI000367F045|nr:TonB-dependent receptor [Teredinibacter turnerae]
MVNSCFVKKRLALAISITTLPALSQFASAQQEAQQVASGKLEEMVVTSARREQTVQEIPLNISAVGAEKIEELRLNNIADISRYVPGLTVIDRGPRNESADIFVRGLNTTSLGPGFESTTVATYLGNIPVDVNLKPNDLERVEVLIGPQGTLYGQGTMGGAIRYIPKAANLSELSGEIRGDISSNAESSGIGRDFGFTLNIPLLQDTLAFRASADKLEDPGFIDYNYVVREPGVSDPEPDFTDPDAVAANLKQVEDANGESTLSGRANLRWEPSDMWDINLWYYYQDTKAEGRQVANQLAFGTGPFESAARYEEPNHYTNDLLSLDIEADLGFASATLTWGKSTYEELGQRDQTDLLIGFEYGYEAFPSFSAYTREEVESESDTIEARLVSQSDGPFQWVVGYFDYSTESDAISEEFTPGFDQFAVDNFGGVALRPDSLEYIQLTYIDESEKALYGEVSYDILPSLTATLGYRSYEYSVNNEGGFGLPLYDTVFDGADPNAVNVETAPNSGDDSGDLYKLNLAYDIDDDNMIYATYSEGYRKGGVNTVPECTEDELRDDNDDQKLCAQPDEVLIDPDTIANYELGYKGILLDGALSINSALYYIDWQDLQVSTTTEFGSLPIIGNGSAAESKGLELSGEYLFAEHWTMAFSYAYTKAKLTDYAVGLVGNNDVLAGSRLPGHAEHQGAINLTYSTEIAQGALDLNYGVVYTGEIYNVVGGPDDPLLEPVLNDDDQIVGYVDGDYGGEALDAWDVHHLSATYSRNSWKVQAYIDNLWDKYYSLGTRTTRRAEEMLQDEQNGPGSIYGEFTRRSYGNYVGKPRTIGLKLSYNF